MANVGDYSGKAQPGMPQGSFGDQEGYAKKLGAFGMGAQVAGAAGEALGAYYSAKSTKMNLEMSAEFMRLSASQDEQRAVDVAHNYSDEHFRMSLKAGQLEGAQRARAFAQGGGGESIQRIMADTKFFSALDNQTLASNEEKELFSIRQQARGKIGAAKAAELQAKGISPRAALIGQLAGSAGSMFLSASAAKQKG